MAWVKQRSLRARAVEVLEGRNGEGDESTCGETIYRGWEVKTIFSIHEAQSLY